MWLQIINHNTTRSLEMTEFRRADWTHVIVLIKDGKRRSHFSDTFVPLERVKSSWPFMTQYRNAWHWRRSPWAGTQAVCDDPHEWSVNLSTVLVHFFLCLCICIYCISFHLSHEYIVLYPKVFNFYGKHDIAVNTIVFASVFYSLFIFQILLSFRVL